MNLIPRSCIPAVLSAAAATLILIAGSSVAAEDLATAPQGLVNNPSRAANAALPDHAMAGTAMTGQLNTRAFRGGKIKLSLPDGRNIEVRRQRILEDKGQGLLSWMGTVDEMQGSLLSLTQYRGNITGFLTYGSETWEIIPADNGQHLVYQVDEDRLPAEDPPISPESSGFESTATGDATASDSVAAGASGYVIDLLIVYTPAARNYHGQSTLESMAQNAVAAANQAYINSNIDITLNLVGLQEINYTESGDTLTSLYDLRGTSDGKMDSVHRTRDNVGADVVSLLTRDSGCGRGFVMAPESSSFASSAFNVVRTTCLSNFTLAHEIGHNQGNRHNRESASGSGAFPYSYGYRRCVSDGSGFRTVMSYSCSGAKRVAHFSSPNANYNGYSTGVKNSEDNALSMWNTADTMSAFRAAAGGTTETAPTAPSSLSATADTESRIIVRWKDNSGNEKGFRLERSRNGVDFAEIAMLGANTTSYSDTGLADGTTYYYRVRAYNSVGNSAFSNTDSATTPAAATETVPAAPASLSANPDSSSRITVRWTDRSDNETGFRLERSGNGSDFTQIATLGRNATAYSDTGLTANKTYYYRVRAYNSVGNSSYSNTGSATTSGDEAPPAKPSSVSASNNGDGTATVSWTDASTNETGFEILREKYNDRKRTWGSAKLIGPVSANVTRIIDSSNSGAFRYSVRAVNASGKSAYAGPRQVTVTGGKKGGGRGKKR
jgi:hypothetical protein